MNLGGPDCPEAVKPFLFNLFSDPAILRLPSWLRLPLARLMARHRAGAAGRIYAQLGGSSPLLANTVAQGRALEAALGPDHRCFVAMRYWHPMSDETARMVQDWAPDEVICLPLYPQFSTTTTASSLMAWREAVSRCGLDRPTRIIDGFATAPGFIEALARLVRPALRQASSGPGARLLLSAHGLPKRIVRAGDPYPSEVEQTAAALVDALAWPGLDWRVCYQSRVGPVAWIGPSTDHEIRRAGAEGVALVVVPISFVSEHSETLVELDRDYRSIAEEAGVPGYYRVPAVGTEEAFIEALAALVRREEAAV